MIAIPSTIRIALSAVVIIAAIFDLRLRRIPNWLTLSGLFLGFSLNLLFFEWHGALVAFEGLAFATAVYLPLYMLRGMGAGDVKLMAAVGALVGPGHWFEILLVTTLAGAVAGTTYACLKGRLSEVCCNLYFLVKDLIQLRAPHKTNAQLDFRNPTSLRMPHGVVIAFASLACLGCELLNPHLLSNLLR